MEVENYEDDPDFVDAIFTNYKAIQKFIDNLMKAYSALLEIAPTSDVLKGHDLESFEEEKTLYKNKLIEVTKEYALKMKAKGMYNFQEEKDQVKKPVVVDN